MFTNVAVQVHTNILTAVVRQYLSCYYFGKGVVNVYRACALSLAFKTHYYQFCPISGIHTSYRGGGGGAGISAQSPNLPPPPKNFIIIINLFSAKYKV